MSNEVKPTNRIPPLPLGAMTNSDGTPTPDELLFRQNLMTSLQKIAGSEGLVAPSQTAADIATIVANTATAQNATTTNYTCEAGTFFYNTTTNTVHVTILVAGIPTLRQVVLV